MTKSLAFERPQLRLRGLERGQESGELAAGNNLGAGGP